MDRQSRLKPLVSVALVLCLLAGGLGILAYGPVTQDAKAGLVDDLVNDAKKSLTYIEYNALFGQTPAGTDDPNVKALNTWYAEFMMHQLQTDLDIQNAAIASILGGSTNATQYAALDNWYARMAEYGASELYDQQNRTTKDFVYDPDYVLSRAGALSDISGKLLSQTTTFYNLRLSDYDTQADYFTGDEEGMEWGVVSWGNAAGDGVDYMQKEASRLDYHPTLDLTFTYMLPVSTGTPQYLWMDTNNTLMATSLHGGMTGTLRVYDAYGVNVANYTTSGSYGQMQYLNLSADAHLPEGEYYLGGDTNAAIFGEAVGASNDTAMVYPALVVTYLDSDQTPLFDGVLRYDGTHVQTYCNGLPETSGGLGAYNQWYDLTSRLYFSPAALDDTNGVSSPNATDPTAIFQEMALIQGQATQMLHDAINIGQAYYNLLVITDGGEGYAPRPTWEWGDISDISDLTWQQIVAMLEVQYNQAKDWFANHAYLDLSNVSYSLESMDLIVRGAIYDDNGTLLSNETTIWTPYISTDDVSLVLGNNTWNQIGQACIWGYQYPVGGIYPDSPNMTVTRPGLIQLHDGYVLDIEMMWYQGAEVSNITLHRSTLDITLYQHHQQGPGPQTTAPGLNWLLGHYWWVIAAGIGAICLVAGIAIGRWEVVMIGFICLIIAVAGWYFADHSIKLFGIFDLYGKLANVISLVRFR